MHTSCGETNQTFLGSDLGVISESAGANHALKIKSNRLAAGMRYDKLRRVTTEI